MEFLQKYDQWMESQVVSEEIKNELDTIIDNK